MNAAGGGDHPLASPGEADVRYASWSPDGSRIVYQGALIANVSAHNLYVVNSDGSGSAQPLTSDGKSEDPAWRVVSSTPQAPPPNPGAAKPKVVWITKRIPWQPGRPIIVASYFCDAPSCSVSTEGKMKSSRAAGLTVRPWTGSARAKSKKPKLVLVGSGKTTVPGGATRKIKLRLNKVGAAVLKKRGTAKIRVALTVKIAGQATKETESHSIVVYLKKAKKPKH